MTVSFDNARIPDYEIHGIVTLIAFFPIGFALLATKRYYKTHWFAMHILHIMIGLLTTLAIFASCLHVYAYVDWK